MSDENKTDKSTLTPAEKNDSKEIHGGRNLMLLGIFAALIAIISTAISLFIYRASGDIYIDRSRPGYISENKDEEGQDSYKPSGFSETGPVDQASLEEYLTQLDYYAEKLDGASDSFSSETLSDYSLGLYYDGSLEGSEDVVE